MKIKFFILLCTILSTPLIVVAMEDDEFVMVGWDDDKRKQFEDISLNEPFVAGTQRSSLNEPIYPGQGPGLSQEALTLGESVIIELEKKINELKRSCPDTRLFNNIEELIKTLKFYIK